MLQSTNIGREKPGRTNIRDEGNEVTSFYDNSPSLERTRNEGYRCKRLQLEKLKI